MRKFISYILIFAICVGTLPADVYSQASALPNEISPAPISEPQTVNADKFTIPANLGDMTGAFKGVNGKTVIHIQDAHCYYNCQLSTEGIIGHLSKEYGVDLAVLEGGAGEYDLSLFTKIKNGDLRAKLADFFVKQGRVNGAELFAIKNPGKVTLKGIEDEDLYISNLKVYRETLSRKKEIDNIIGAVSDSLNSIKEHVYSPKLKELGAHRQDYNDKKTELDVYLGALNSLSKEAGYDPSSYPELCRLMRVIEGEKGIDFSRAEAERETLIKYAVNRLSDTEIAALTEKAARLKKGDMRQAEFYSYLFRKAATVGFDIDNRFPNLSEYKKYIDTYESIDNAVLFRELEEFEDGIAGGLFENRAQQEVYELLRALDIIRGLYNISMSRDKYDLYLRDKGAYAASRFISFIKNETLKYQDVPAAPENTIDLDKYREGMEKFYEISFSREEAFMGNIVKYARDKEALVVVTGGFHAEGLKALLKEKGYSYISVMPRMDGDKTCPYVDLLSGGLSKIERDVNRAISAMAFYSPFTGLGIRAAGVYDPAGNGERALNGFQLAVLLEEHLMRDENAAFRVKAGDGEIVICKKEQVPADAIMVKEVEISGRPYVRYVARTSQNTGRVMVFTDAEGLKKAFANGDLLTLGMNILNRAHPGKALRTPKDVSRYNERVTNFDIAILPLLTEVPRAVLSDGDWGISGISAEGIEYANAKERQFVSFIEPARKVIGGLIEESREDYFLRHIDAIAKISVTRPFHPVKEGLAARLIGRGSEMLDLFSAQHKNFVTRTFMNEDEYALDDPHIEREGRSFIALLFGMLEKVPDVMASVDAREDWDWVPSDDGIEFTTYDGSREFVPYVKDPAIADAPETRKVKEILLSLRELSALNAVNVLDGLAVRTGTAPTEYDRRRREMELDLAEYFPLAATNYAVFDGIARREGIKPAEVVHRRFTLREIDLINSALRTLPNKIITGQTDRIHSYRPAALQNFAQSSYGNNDSFLALAPLSMRFPGTLTKLAESPELALYFSGLTDGELTELSFVRIFLHEKGHRVFNSLPGRARQAYGAVSWESRPKMFASDAMKKEAKEDKREHFLITYPFPEWDASEDFTDHLTAYIMFAPQFREAAKRSKAIEKKYNFIKEVVFGGGEFPDDFVIGGLNAARKGSWRGLKMRMSSALKHVTRKVRAYIGGKVYPYTVTRDIPAYDWRIKSIPEIKIGLSGLLKSYTESNGKEGRATNYLDACGGFGCAATEAAARYGAKGLKSYVVDINEYTAKDLLAEDAARARASGKRRGVEDILSRQFTFLKADIATVKLPEKMDIITVIAGLQFVDDPLTAVVNLYDQLNRNGILVGINVYYTEHKGAMEAFVEALRAFSPLGAAVNLVTEYSRDDGMYVLKFSITRKDDRDVALNLAVDKDRSVYEPVDRKRNMYEKTIYYVNTSGKPAVTFAGGTAGGALKYMGTEREDVPSGILSGWIAKADTIGVSAKKVRSPSIERAAAISAKFIEEPNMPEGMTAYHFRDKSGELVIVSGVPADSAGPGAAMIDESIYHEYREDSWERQGLGGVDAHRLASAEQVIAFGFDGKYHAVLTPCHERMLKELAENRPGIIEKLAGEKPQDRLAHYALYEKYLPMDISKIEVYEGMVREKVLALDPALSPGWLEELASGEWLGDAWRELLHPEAGPVNVKGVFWMNGTGKPITVETNAAEQLKALEGVPDGAYVYATVSDVNRDGKVEGSPVHYQYRFIVAKKKRLVEIAENGGLLSTANRVSYDKDIYNGDGSILAYRDFTVDGDGNVRFGQVAIHKSLSGRGLGKRVFDGVALFVKRKFPEGTKVFLVADNDKVANTDPKVKPYFNAIFPDAVRDPEELREWSAVITREREPSLAQAGDISKASRIENDLDSIMSGANGFRMAHVKLVNESFRQFTRGAPGFEFLYNNINNPVVKAKTPDKGKYFTLLGEALGEYEKLGDKEKYALLLGTILHDVGYAKTKKDWEHWKVGREAVAGILKNYGVVDPEIVNNVEDIVGEHSKIADLGLDRLPADLRKMPLTLRTQILIITLMDTAGKLERKPPHRPDNILSTQFLEELLHSYRAIDTMTDKEFLDRRLRAAGMPRAFQISRPGLELEPAEISYLEGMAAKDPVFFRIWSTNIRNNVFPLFLVLKNRKDAYLPAEKLFKLQKLIAHISDVYLSSGKAAPGTILTLDITGEEFTDPVFEKVLGGMDKFFAMDIEDINDKSVRGELERSLWTQAFGMDLRLDGDRIFIDTKALASRPAIGPEYVKDSSKEMIKILNGASLINEPCVVGMVVKARKTDNVDLILEEKFAADMEILGKRLGRKIQLNKGIVEFDADKVRYIAYVDDGTETPENLARMEEFKNRIKSAQEATAGRPAITKERTFAWILSNDKRKDEKEYIKSVNEVANLVGLDGEYIPVSWQMLVGPMFANLMDSKSRGTTDESERINAIVDGIVRSVAIMTRKELKELDGLKEELRRSSLSELMSKLNGRFLVFYLPPIIPVSQDAEAYRKADESVRMSV